LHETDVTDYIVHGVKDMSRGRRAARHRTGTPGLTPYRLRAIEPGPMKHRTARHRKRVVRRITGAQVALALAAATALVLLVLSGYRAAEGAGILLGAF
jgi:hypothetical protein